MSIYFVIFGASVRSDGTPSATLRRRVESAVIAARGFSGARFMPTGGAGSNGYVEADVMTDLLLQAGIPHDAIIAEREARDTLDSICKCNILLRKASDVESIAPCTSPYHLPRCSLLFRASGWNVRRMAMLPERPSLSWRKLALYSLKEVLALPYDLFLILIKRKFYFTQP